MIILGLTGSIGMGKSTTAAMLREEGIPVYDSDAAVHELYAKGGKAVEPVGAAFPGAVRDGAIDRALLGKLALGDNAALKKLESIVHPLVRETQAAFVRKHHAAGAPAVVLDIPLLFESRADQIVDAVIVVTAPPAVQRRRLLARPGMTEEKLAHILARQIPDAEKREKADFLINTEFGLEDARNQVRAVLAVLREAA
ncbi:MAG TPA: dephospho-CoA kinase [Caulobacterales bacterium]|nr:dephospho-CoA kinase [Caulobacterales bacterium]